MRLKRFSERRGLKKGRMDVQVDSMDVSLRNRLWNTLERFYWKGAQDVIRRGYVIKIGDLNPKLKEILEKQTHVVPALQN